MQKEVDAALAVLDSYAKPTIAFHGERAADTFHSGAYTLMQRLHNKSLLGCCPNVALPNVHL